MTDFSSSDLAQHNIQDLKYVAISKKLRTESAAVFLFATLYEQKSKLRKTKSTKSHMKCTQAEVMFYPLNPKIYVLTNFIRIIYCNLIQWRLPFFSAITVNS